MRNTEIKCALLFFFYQIYETEIILNLEFILSDRKYNLEGFLIRCFFPNSLFIFRIIGWLGYGGARVM